MNARQDPRLHEHPRASSSFLRQDINVFCVMNALPGGLSCRWSPRPYEVFCVVNLPHDEVFCVVNLPGVEVFCVMNPPASGGIKVFCVVNPPHYEVFCVMKESRCSA